MSDIRIVKFQGDYDFYRLEEAVDSEYLQRTSVSSWWAWATIGHTKIRALVDLNKAYLVASLDGE